MNQVDLPRVKSLQDADFKARLQDLRRTDNRTNLLYLAAIYLYFLVVIGGAVAFFEFQAGGGACFLWNIPVAFLAITLVGAGQHQLSGLGHEGSHHTLFRGRLYNELVADWFCMYPLFSTLYHYRLQHLAHHQFVNDPDRDPDVSQLKQSGHWLNFPIPRARFLRSLVRQLWLPNLIRFILVRAKYNSMATDKNPYVKKDLKTSKIPLRMGVLYLLGLVAILTTTTLNADRLLLAVLPPAWWLCMMVGFTALPSRLFSHSRIHPVYSPRIMTLMRMTFITALFTTLAWITLETGRPAALYFLVLWVVPLLSSFSFFMILRQIVQHGNGGRGWLTNTRIFLVNRMIRFAVFPMGQDYHLPHHLYATVPHYRLRELHELLMEYPEYREQATVVEGYFLHAHQPPHNPTVLDVLERDDRVEGTGVYIDNTVLDNEEVDEKPEILRIR